MNTPAHVVINLAVLGPRRWVSVGFAVLLGALLPDAAMFVFYAWQKSVVGLSEELIWSQAYFEPAWQNFFDVFNSIPLIVLLGLIGWRMRSLFVEALSLSLLLHCALDLPLHHDDGHRHFYPFSDWRFESPVSYWDPAHFGHYAMAAEALLALISIAYLWRSQRPQWVRLTALVFAAA